MDRFERGVIYWHPAYGAFPITGRILDSWEFSGFEAGTLGYPTSDQYNNPEGFLEQVFENHVVTVDGDAPAGPQAKQNYGLIEFNSGDDVTLEDARGRFDGQRAADGYDTRYLTMSWTLSDSYILSKSAYGLATRKDRTAYIFGPDTGRFLMQDRAANHKGMAITRRYRGHGDRSGS